MGGKLENPWLDAYIIQKDLGKGRYCLKTLEGKPLNQMQTIHCARLKHFLDPEVEDNIVDEAEEIDISSNGISDSVHHEENDNKKGVRVSE